jgi:anaerobic selenocysteine-containing dehydrogenase
MSLRAPSAEEHRPSACPLDCPDACSLDVTVSDGRVVAIAGSRVNPLTEGFICAKVRRIPEHLYGPARMLHPGIRTGRKGEGAFRRASWDEALALVADRLREASARRGEAILPFSYGGSNGYLSQDTTDARLFRRLGASRLARTVCAAPTGRAAAGLYGKMTGTALPDYVHAKLIVLWGMNPAASGIHLLPHIQEARRRGARLAVIDPRRTRLADGADVYLPIHPGTDLPVALALLNWLFANGRADRAFLAKHATGAEELARRAEPWTLERAAREARVPAADIERLARLYADESPAVIRCGWGPERNRNGGSAIAAVLALPAVAGKFGVRGGGYTLSNSSAWREIDGAAAAAAEEPPTRVVNMNRLGEMLARRDADSVEVLFVYNCNPAVTMPDQMSVLRGLEREDLFTVVFDPVMTDTARYADVVLPAAAFLERRELSRGYGALVLQDADAVVPPAGEARPNHEVFAELCRRTGIARPGDAETADALVDAILRTSPRAETLRRDLDTQGFAVPLEGAAPVQFVDSFPKTADGKAHLVPEDLDREAPSGLYHYRPETAARGFPLALISPATDRTISSSLGELHRAHVPLLVHPADAAERSLVDGDSVRVFNALGEVRCRVRLDDAVRPGVVVLSKGIWRHNTESGTTATALAPATLADLGGGACFNDSRVEVAKADPA